MTDNTIIPVNEIQQIEPVQETRQVFLNEFDVQCLLSTTGKLESTDEQRKTLFAPVNEADVEIRPDGLVYLPWTWHAGRLTKAYPLRWTLIPQGMPKFHENLIIWGFWLVIEGILCGFAIGEQKYIATNRQMSYTDAVEGAKSNALMRLCKGIGMGHELWNKEWDAKWQKKHAEQYIDEDGKKKWRKKNAKKSSAPTMVEAAVEIGGEVTETKIAPEQPANDEKEYHFRDAPVVVAISKAWEKPTEETVLLMEAAHKAETIPARNTVSGFLKLLKGK
jgi:hypothetical protein